MFGLLGDGNVSTVDKLFKFSKSIKCMKCGGDPECFPDDEGPYTIECNDCGYSTISWAYMSEAWKCWRNINGVK